MTAVDQALPTRAYLAGLEGIRGFGCLGVIAAHSWVHWAPVTTPGGMAQSIGLALVLFFVMSGLLIYLPFARDIVRNERRVGVRRYAVRRLARVFPAYLAIFAVSDLLLRAVYVENAVSGGRTGSDAGAGMITDPFTLLANLSLTQTLIPSTMQTGINPAWSLTTELCFYASLPLLAVPLVGRAAGWTNRAFWLAAAPGLLLIVVGLVSRAVAEAWWRATPGMPTIEAEYGDNGIAVLTRSFLAIADNFGLGMLIAVLFLAMEGGGLRWLTRTRMLIAGTVLCGAAGGMTLLAAGRAPWFVTSAMSLCAGVMILVLVEATARRTPSRIVSVFDGRVLNHIGAISLSAYLWHFPVIIVISRIDHRVNIVGGDSWATIIWAPILVSAVAIALGSLSHRWIEKPAMDWSHGR